jgi:hypothetical protein
MHDLTGTISGVSFSYINGKPQVTFELNERKPALDMVDCLRSYDKLAIKIDRYKEKRSLNANNYAWKLITEIGNATRQSKEDVYFLMLKRYGQSEMVSVVADVPVQHYFKHYEEAGESTLKGKLFKHYRVYKGSSEFDTKEMSIFIDGIVSEAKELGIETMTPNELAKMKSLWGE